MKRIKKSLIFFIAAITCNSIACSKEKAGKGPETIIYATSLTIDLNNENPKLEEVIMLSPKYTDKVDRITWFVDGVETPRSSSSNQLQYKFKDLDNHTFRAEAKVGSKSLSAVKVLKATAVYASKVIINSSKEVAVLDAEILFTPVLDGASEKITWFVDGVEAGREMVDESNKLKYKFTDKEEHNFKVKVKTNQGEIEAEKKMAAVKSFKVIAFFSANWDVAHISYAHEANKWFPEIADRYGFTYDSTQNWNNLNDAFLADYQVVLFLDNVAPSGAPRVAFEKYMKNGGGFIGFHVAAFNTDPKGWDWYFNEFLGTGGFAGNTWKPTAATLLVENQNHPSTQGMPKTFRSSPNEWYKWSKDLKANPDISILMSIDQSSFPVGTDPNQSWYSGYYPVVWTNKNYKMLYVNMGHNDMLYNPTRTVSYTFDNDIQNSFMIKSLLWLGGRIK